MRGLTLFLSNFTPHIKDSGAFTIYVHFEMWYTLAWVSYILVLQCLVRYGSQLQQPLQSALSLKHFSLNHDLIEFHKNLTEIESITYNEDEVGGWLAASLESQGYHVEKQFVEEDPVRFNVYAYPGKVRETRILVSSHIDTVRR